MWNEHSIVAREKWMEDSPKKMRGKNERRSIWISIQHWFGADNFYDNTQFEILAILLFRVCNFFSLSCGKSRMIMPCAWHKSEQIYMYVKRQTIKTKKCNEESTVFYDQFSKVDRNRYTHFFIAWRGEWVLYIYSVNWFLLIQRRQSFGFRRGTKTGKINNLIK